MSARLSGQAEPGDLPCQGVEQLIHKLSGGMGKIKPSQIKKIYKRFGDIDVDKSGAIDYEEFIQAMDMEDTNIAREDKDDPAATTTANTTIDYPSHCDRLLLLGS
ncbi:Calmodulin [Symbiodinium sp. CCMP2456]|nr:Calmodulin [Symbiodinium sp. CCMP2456]